MYYKYIPIFHASHVDYVYSIQFNSIVYCRQKVHIQVQFIYMKIYENVISKTSRSHVN